MATKIPKRTRTVAMVAGASGLALFLRAPWLGQPIARDAAEYALIGSRLGPHFVPYRDFLDNKQPFAFVVFRFIAWIAPRSEVAIRLTAAALASLTVVATFLLLRRLVDTRHAAIASALVAVAGASGVVEGFDLNTEHILVPAAAITVLGLLAAQRRHYGWIPFAAGAAVGICVLIKAVGIFVAPAVLIAVLAWSGSNHRSRVRATAWFAAGAMTPIAAVAALYTAIGAASSLWVNVTFNIDYLNQFPVPKPRELFIFGWQLQVLVVVAVAVAVIRLASTRGRDLLTQVTLVWLIGALAGAKLGRHELLHYYAPVVVPASILVCLPVRIARSAVALTAALAAVVVVPFASDIAAGFGVDPVVLATDHYGDQALVWTHQADAGRWLRARAAPGDRMFVAAAEPAIYWLSGIEPASYYLFDYPKDIYPARYRATVFRELSTDPPRYVVLPLGVRPTYLDFIASAYRDVERFGSIRILERRNSSPGHKRTVDTGT